MNKKPYAIFNISANEIIQDYKFLASRTCTYISYNLILPHLFILLLQRNNSNSNKKKEKRWNICFGFFVIYFVIKKIYIVNRKKINPFFCVGKPKNKAIIIIINKKKFLLHCIERKNNKTKYLVVYVSVFVVLVVSFLIFLQLVYLYFMWNVLGCVKRQCKKKNRKKKYLFMCVCVLFFLMFTKVSNRLHSPIYISLHLHFVFIHHSICACEKI